MYVEGEVKHRRSCRQYPQLSRRGEYEYLLAGRCGHVFGAGAERMFQGVAHTLEPAVYRGLVPYALVGPVRRVAALRLDVHTLCAYLNLEGVAPAVLDRYVQRFVAVGARRGEPVAQSRDIGLVFFGNERVDLPAEVLLHRGVFVAVDYEAYREYVEYALERHFLRLHLAVYRVCALGAYLQLVSDAGFGELLLQRPYELRSQPLAVLLGGL